MSVVKAISIRDINSHAQDLKSYAEEYIITGEKFPARMDVWFQEGLLATILFPPTTPETFEGIACRAAWACSAFGGTHFVFAHRAEIAISSSVTQEELNATATPCMCVYQVSFLTAYSAVLPYTWNEGDPVVDWSENSPENSPLRESEMLQVLMFLSSQLDIKVPSPQLYLAWLENAGYQVTFHEPYTAQNFAYQGSF